MIVCLLTHICVPRPQWVKKRVVGVINGMVIRSQNGWRVFSTMISGESWSLSKTYLYATSNHTPRYIFRYEGHRSHFSGTTVTSHECHSVLCHRVLNCLFNRLFWTEVYDSVFTGWLDIICINYPSGCLKVMSIGWENPQCNTLTTGSIFVVQSPFMF